MVEENKPELIQPKSDNKKKIVNLIVFVIGAILVFCLLLAFTGLPSALTIFSENDIPLWQQQAQLPFAILFILYLIGVFIYYFYRDKIKDITRKNESAVIQKSSRNMDDLILDEAKYFRIRLGNYLHTRYPTKGESQGLPPFKWVYYECLSDSTQTRIGITKWKVDLIKNVNIDLVDRYTIDRETKARELHGDSKEEIKTKLSEGVGSKKRKEVKNIHGDEDSEEEIESVV